MKCVACEKETRGSVDGYPACEECYVSDKLYEWFKIHDPSMIFDPPKSAS